MHCPGEHQVGLPLMGSLSLSYALVMLTGVRFCALACMFCLRHTACLESRRGLSCCPPEAGLLAMLSA